MLRLRDIMTTELTTFAPDVTLRDALETLAALHLSGAPVVTGHRVVGVISASDLLTFVASTPPVPAERSELAAWEELEAPTEWREGEEAPATYFEDLWEDVGAEVDERFNETHGAEWDPFAEHTVGEVMARTIVSLPGSAPVEQAADVMRQAAVHRILVMEAGGLRGIVTMKDISDAVAEHKLSKKTYVFGAESKFADREYR